LGLYLENPSGIEKSQPALTREEFRRLRHTFYSEISLEEFFPRLSYYQHDMEARGESLFELGNNCLIASMNREYDYALHNYRLALEILGDKPQLIHNMAIAQIGSGDTKGGIELLRKVGRMSFPSKMILKAFESNGKNPKLLSQEACTIFFSDHPVAKGARQGLGIDL
jgi:hypothetical protein